MTIITENKFETIEIPVLYKNVFLKIVDSFSAKEVEEKFFVDEENIISKKIKEIKEKEKKGKINFVSFEQGEKNS